jgi:hypothetical protein
LVHRDSAWVALGLLACGLVLLVGGSAVGSVGGTRAGSSSVLAGSLLIAAQYPRIFRGRNERPVPQEVG